MSILYGILIKFHWSFSIYFVELQSFRSCVSLSCQNRLVDLFFSDQNEVCVEWMLVEAWLYCSLSSSFEWNDDQSEKKKMPSTTDQRQQLQRKNSSFISATIIINVVNYEIHDKYTQNKKCDETSFRDSISFGPNCQTEFGHNFDSLCAARNAYIFACTRLKRIHTSFFFGAECKKR